MFFQGFESGETSNYSGTPSTSLRYSTNIRLGGQRALKIVQSTTQNVEIILDTIDFTQNTTLRYIAFRFDHICRLPRNSSQDYQMGMIYYKRANQTNWTLMSSSEYNVSSGNATNDFSGYFFSQSYSDWWTNVSPTVSNDQWRSERFDLDNLLPPSVPADQRKVLIKFVVNRRTNECSEAFDTVNLSWWIDNIRVSASSERMVTPKILMLEYPTVEQYPNSRGAHIELQATTSVTAGINPDSVYLVYKGGSDPTEHILPMTAGTGNRFDCRIPFYGYDTMMYFYCVVCDATGNANRATYPPTSDTWVSYRCVRGPTVQPGIETPELTGTSSSTFFPFPSDADHRCEMVYDSVLMKSAGYGPGAITSLKFTVDATVQQARTDNRFQIKMKNAPNSHTVAMADDYKYWFSSDAMQVVYDSSLTIPTMPSNLSMTINLQDTFYYSGSDLIIQMTYDNAADRTSGISVKTIPTSTDKQTIFFFNGTASYGYNPFSSEDFRFTQSADQKRPAFVFNETHLQPLLYDMGFDTVVTSPTYGLVTPNGTTPMTPNDHSVQVRLMNYGAMEANSIQISYSIDDVITGDTTWVGSLQGGAFQLMTIAPNIPLEAGTHTLKVWVEDTLTSAGQHYRDHEPYNDTIKVLFNVCEGPMNGVRTIGGTNPDFNTIEDFLFSLSQCGVDDSLIVRLAPGEYPPFVMPAVASITPVHYVVFESMGPQQAVLCYNSMSSLDAIVNLENVGNIRFRNLTFRRDSGVPTDLVTLGPNSTNCQFYGCTFSDALGNSAGPSMRINSMINTGNAENMLVDSCFFNGANIGVNIRGTAPDNHSEGAVVRKSTFNNQYSNAVKVEYMDSIALYENKMYDVVSNSSYVILLNGCSGAINVDRNRVFTSHGAGGMAFSDVTGSTGRHVLVSNNMIESADDGTANLLNTPFYIIQGDWIDVVYNSVKLVAPTRVNVAAVTFGGGAINNCSFVNNIVASVDHVNYAFNYQPLGSTTNVVSNNNYFSNGTTLNRRGSSSYVSIDGWRAAVTDDSLSVSVNPNFLDSALVDLRTYNRNLKGVGIPLAAVTVDIFGNLRGDSATCPGAFEFSSLPYDFEPEALISPLLETCNMPASVELVVRMRNNGIASHDTNNVNPVQLSCRVNNGPVHTLTVNDSIPADDTVTIHTGYMLSLPSGTFNDASYTIRLWNSCADDPNPSNDTSVFTIVSRYHPAAPADIIDSIDYATNDTIVPTVGINTWQVYGSSSAPRPASTIYWYHDMSDAEPFHVGPYYITDVLHSNADFYIRQRRAMPIVRITQVELMRNATAAGLTSPMPYWMEPGRKAALQLTNIGDATAYLEGDTLKTVSPTSGLNNKVYVFGNVKIEPGQSLVVQYVGTGVTDSSITIRNGLTPSFTASSKVAFVYIRKGVIEDAVVFEPTTTTSTQWTSLSVPSYIWSGSGMSFPTNTAGVYRSSFNGGVGDWEFSTAATPMFLGATDEDWIMYEDFGCEGDFAHVEVALRTLPVVDVSVSEPILPEGGCSMAVEPIIVNVANYGADTAVNVVMNYCAGGDTITDTIMGIIPPFGDTTYTFLTQMNFAFPTDSLVTVRVWSEADTNDPIRFNDTAMATVYSRFTPAAPAPIADRTVFYGERDTITMTPASTLLPVWYDSEGNAVDTGYSSISEILYIPQTRGMAYVALHDSERQIGSDITTNANTAFPSPYQASSKYARQQFIYSAADMAAAGAERGYLTSLSFYFDTLVGSTSSINYLDYTITLGMTPDTIHSGGAPTWKEVSTIVFSRDTFTLTQTDDHAWVSHPFDTLFFWDGVSSVVVDVTYNLSAKINTGVKTRYSAKTNTTLHKNQDNVITATTGTKGNNRPNIKFTNRTFGCVGPITSYNVLIDNVPEYDMALMWADGYDTLQFNSCDTVFLPVILRNQGDSTIASPTIFYQLDNNVVNYDNLDDTLVSGETVNTTILNDMRTPGRHTITAFISVPGDNIHSNDTIRTTFTVRFCGGNYTIAANDPTADYSSFSAAIDTLNQVGVVGPVNFQIAPGVYNEQVVLNNVEGSSDINTINFIGQSDSVLLTASTGQNSNYVMMIDGASNVNIHNLMIEARPVANNVNYANALVLMNDSSIHVTDCHIKVKGTIANINASCIVLQGNVSDLTVSGTVTDSGYYAFRTAGAVTDYASIHLHDNVFQNFASGGIYIRGIERVNITHNEIRSGNSANNRGLIGIYMAATTDSMVIQKNSIYLVDQRNSAKRGVQLENVVGTLATPAWVVNNMISTHGLASGGLTPAKSAGVWIDSTSAYVNVFYNSIRVHASNITPNSTANQINAANDLSYAFWCGASPSQITVMNNIISNLGYGYAYYVSQANTVTSSDYNAFFTEASKKFAWGTATTLSTLAELQANSSTDATSVLEEPYFVSSENLHLRMTNFAGKAQYNSDVIDDIDGVSRLPLGPTIGAHEKYRENHDMAVVRITKPSFYTENIETDSVLVVATFNNNGLSNESGIYWYAYIDGYEAQTSSAPRSLGSFAPSQMKTDSVLIPTTFGIIDTQSVHVVVFCNGDQAMDDNEMTELFYLAPAFNLAAVKVTATNDYVPAGCRMQNTVIRINVKNAGSKDFPAGTQFRIGYHTEITNPTDITVNTLPDFVEQDVTLDNILPQGSDVWFTFDSIANLYPTGHYTNIKVRVKGWVYFMYDITRFNDTTSNNTSSSPIKDSYYTPASPVGETAQIAYGAWGSVSASQENSIPIRWYRDSTQAFFFPGSNQVAINTANYNRSTLWNTTPQFFHDSTYYLNALSDKQCPSYFSSVHVTVLPQKTRDMAMEDVLAPLGGRVYMENDTVRVRIANYGTQAQSNFPITYQLKRGANIIQTVTDTVTATVAPDDTCIFTFDTLLAIPTPLTAQSYSLNVWTDLSNDATRLNDTLRVPHTFASRSQERYNTPEEFPGSNKTRFDITRVAFNGIDLDMPALNRSYTNLADYTNPDYPVLHVTRGTTDSILIRVTPLDATEQVFRCRGTVQIDFDRDGLFSSGGPCNETLVDGEVFYCDSALTSLITIPTCASLGYMRMRVKVRGYAADSDEGHVIDFLLFVDESAPSADLALTQIVSPRDYIIRDDSPRVVTFRMANRGSNPISEVDIHYSFIGDTIDSTATGIYHWTGALNGGQSTLVSLPSHVFPLGTSSLIIWHNMEGDVDSSNNVLQYEYHFFHYLRPIVRDDFEGIDYWYAPKSYSDYSRNFWQRGAPEKSRLDTAYSGQNAWVTDLTNPIITGRRGSVSYLYSPFINISQVRPDTIAIRLRRNLTNNSSMHIEYYNYERKWIKLAHDSTHNWYNNMDEGVFSGTTSSSGDSYTYYCISASKMGLTSDFNENTQFRLVYTTPMGSSTTASFGEGCAVDDFYIGRARAKIDAGVVDITYPTEPKYGQTIYPKVVVKNYGTDTLRSIRIGYYHYGTYLAKYTDTTCHVAPDSVDTFRLASPFIVTNDFPETFFITAFTTRPDDNYRNNDTVTKDFTLMPLDNDISAESIIAPLNYVVAGDTAVKVTLRIRNFGYNPIYTATASFIVNGINRVDEEIDFMECLGRPLESLEYYNYTFTHRITAPMGMLRLTAIIKSPNNDYIYNDTVTKRVEGIMSITDVAATAVIIDSSAHNEYYVVLVIDNVGARGVNNFTVGYWYDNDTLNNMVRETYYRAQPLPALNRGFYRFDAPLPERSTGYNYISGFVHIDDDNDPSNDTTSERAASTIDIEVMRVLVEENANNDCRVFMELRNIGNIPVDGQDLRLRAVVNGSDSNSTNIQRRVDPGEVIHIELRRRIPKSPTRQYVGTGYIRQVSGDNNQTNDQTSIVEVINYAEDAPSVNRDNLVLEQNYPNPFTQQTTVPFSLPNAARVNFFVMDAMGHIVHRESQFYQSGSHFITVDMEAFAAGVYYYGIEVNGQRQMRKMILK